MKIRLLVLALLALAYPASAIDFTPHYLDYFVGNTLKRRLYFMDGAQKIGFKTNAQTQVDAFEGGARVTFPSIKDASYLLRTSPLDLPFNAGSLEKYRDAALHFAPAGAQDLRVTQELNNPLDIFDWTGYRFITAFTIKGQPAQQEITFLNIKPGQQILLIATAYDPDFEEFTKRTYNIIRSWHPLTAADEMTNPFN